MLTRSLGWTVAASVLCIAALVAGCGKKGESGKPSASRYIEKTRQAAESGSADAQYNLGVAYANGENVPKDGQQAAAWFQKAAEQGHMLAQVNLAAAYSYGFGVPKDLTQAFVWYRRAAERGYPPAQYSLGVAYANGSGIAQSDRESVFWHRKAAEQGFALAQYTLALAYAEGKGVEKDLVQAYKWIGVIAVANDRQAEAKRAEIAAQMTPEQLEQAQQLVKAWKPVKS